MHTLNSKGRQLTITSPIVMGILNATPDSFYNKGRESDVNGLLHTAELMLRQGATILDAGGASTRPGQPLIAPASELERVIPAIIALRREFPDAWLSIDTYNAAVAREAVHAGADIVNDISAGGFDAGMLDAVAALQVPYIAMHIQGTPATMQQDPQYTDVVAEVDSYLLAKASLCCHAGISDIIIDPGFGFGKTVTHNFALLRGLRTFALHGMPVLAGLSRKSMICKPLRVNPDKALNGTTALNMAALINGAAILRVHDVKEAMETVTLYNHLAGKQP